MLVEHALEMELGTAPVIRRAIDHIDGDAERGVDAAPRSLPRPGRSSPLLSRVQLRRPSLCTADQSAGQSQISSNINEFRLRCNILCPGSGIWRLPALSL